MQLPETKKRRVSIYIDQKTEDRIMIHGKKNRRKLATQVTAMVEDQLDALELLEKGE